MNDVSLRHEDSKDWLIGGIWWRTPAVSLEVRDIDSMENGEARLDFSNQYRVGDGIMGQLLLWVY